MLSAFFQNKRIAKFCKYFLILVALLIVIPAYAVGSSTSGTSPSSAGSNPTTASSIGSNVTNALGNLSAGGMLTSLASQIPNLMRLVTAIAYVLGMVFIFIGVLKMKHLGESRTMTSREHSIMGPIIYLVVGALLLYLPTGVQMGTSTFWGSPNPIGYLTGTDQWTQFINDCFSVVQLFGTIAFIRGLVILSHLGSGGGGGQKGLSAGLTHIIGGILCINIYQFVQVIMVTFGIQTS